MDFEKWGEPDAQAPPRLVVEGPWSFLLETGGATAISFAGRELVAKLFFSVRDASWATPILRLAWTDARGSGWTFAGRIGELGLEVAGTAGVEQGRFVMHFHATAAREVEVPRIGPAILHELAALGPIFATDGPVGPRTVDRPQRVGIDRVASRFTTLAFETRGIAASLSFDGVEFEMEDQRNWGDSTLKSYCPPLGGPLIRIPAGSQLDYTVTLDAREVGSDSAAPASPSSEGTTGLLPTIGLAHSGGQLPDTAVHLLRELDLGYLHLLVDLSDPDWQSRLAGDLSASAQLGVEAVLSVNVAAGETYQLEELARASTGRATTAFVYPDGESETSETLAALAASAFAPWGIAVGGGSRSHLASLTSAGGVPGSATVIGFGLAVAAHDNDRRSLAHSPDSFAAMVGEALRLGGERDLLVGPVSFRPTFDPWLAAGSARDLRKDWMAGHPRDGTEFAAAWTIAALGAFAACGVRRVTIAATTGPRGVVGLDGDVARSTPVFEALRLAADYAGAPVERRQPEDRVSGFGTTARQLLGDLTERGPAIRSDSLRD